MNKLGKYLLAGTAAVTGGVFAGIALANVRLEFPGPVDGPPAYAEISITPPWGEAIIRAEEWAAIPFYRQPSCVPEGFNLLDFADVPAAFGCELTVQGFEIWTAPPPDGQGPIEVRIWGMGAVPIYFVRWTELQAEIADRVLTIGELQNLSSLRIGYAGFFVADAHPAMTGPAHQYIGPFQVSAKGVLQDGRQFELQVATGGPAGPYSHVKITFW